MRKLVRAVIVAATALGLLSVVPEAQAHPTTALSCEVGALIRLDPGVNNDPSDGSYDFVNTDMLCEGLHDGVPMALRYDVTASGTTTGDPVGGAPGDGEDCEQGRHREEGKLHAALSAVESNELGGNVHDDLWGTVRFDRVGTVVTVEGELYETEAARDGGAPADVHGRYIAELQFTPNPAQVQQACVDDPPTGAITDATLDGVAEMTEGDASTDLIDTKDPIGKRSDSCKLADGERVVDQTVLGVEQSVWLHQPSTDSLWVCARVEDANGDGYGGALEITPTGLDPSITGGVPDFDVDGASTACTTTTPNDAPGTRPIAAGGIGPADYLLDAYVGADEAWLCLQVESTDTRVVVPLTADQPGVSTGTVATWWPDEGTPTL